MSIAFNTGAKSTASRNTPNRSVDDSNNCNVVRRGILFIIALLNITVLPPSNLYLNSILFLPIKITLYYVNRMAKIDIINIAISVDRQLLYYRIFYNNNTLSAYIPRANVFTDSLQWRICVNITKLPGSCTSDSKMNNNNSNNIVNVLQTSSSSTSSLSSSSSSSSSYMTLCSIIYLQRQVNGSVHTGLSR